MYTAWHHYYPATAFDIQVIGKRYGKSFFNREEQLVRLMVHDLAHHDYDAWLSGFSGDTDEVIGESGSIRHCVGCFGCWIRTPGTSVLKDSYKHMGDRLAACDELVLITRNVYGGYSPFVSNVLNRSLPYVLPYFVIQDGETHHQQRYMQRLMLFLHIYYE